MFLKRKVVLNGDKLASVYLTSHPSSLGIFPNENILIFLSLFTQYKTLIKIYACTISPYIENFMPNYTTKIASSDEKQLR